MNLGTDPASVIVGVHDSLTGLAAVREATRLARALGWPLRAVRASACPQAEARSGWGPAQAWTASPSPSVWEAAERQSQDFIRQAFGSALGGLPEGIPVEAVVTFAPPWEALLGCAAKGDVLVVGASRQGWQPLHRPVSAYCAAHAPCPVLIVPRHPAARDPALAAGPVGWLRRRRALNAVERLALPPVAP